MRQRGTAREKLSADFLNPTLEWRRIFTETWGTFLLVVVAAGSRVVAVKNGGAVTLGMMVVAPGLMVMATMYFMGAVRGAI
jgi:aquaporin Z